MTDTAHAFRRDADDVADVVMHCEAHVPLIANLSTPESDSLLEHYRDMVRHGMPPSATQAFRRTIRQITGHTTAAIALGQPVAGRLDERAVRMHALEIGGGRRGWSIKRRANALRTPLEVLCDPASTDLLRTLALSVVEQLAELLTPEQLLDPGVLRSLGKEKGSKLIDLAVGNESAVPVASGNGAKSKHEGDRVLHH